MANFYGEYPILGGGAGTGTVTSVALTAPAFLSVSGSPITTSGTLALSYSGTALPVANGGTGVTSLGNLTDAGTDGIVVTGGSGSVVTSVSLAQHVADTTHNGYLSSTDWNTFNGKQAGGNYITALTGDGTASGPGSAALTLATVNANVGSFGSSTAIPSFTVNAKGLVTAASTNVVIAPAGTLTGTTLASNVVTSSLTSVGTIATGVWQGTAIGAQFGGTGINTSASTGVPTISAGTWSVSTTLPAAQFPALTGDVTTAGGSLATTAAATQANITSLSNSAGVAVHGTNTNNNAAAGFVGEYVESLVSSAASVPTSDTWGDGTSISLTAGDWDVTFILIYQLNSATSTGGEAYISIGISTTAGNSSTGLVYGSNFVQQENSPSNAVDRVIAIPNYRISLSGTTTVYGKLETGYTIGTPKYLCRLCARRMR